MNRMWWFKCYDDTFIRMCDDRIVGWTQEKEDAINKTYELRKREEDDKSNKQ